MKILIIQSNFPIYGGAELAIVRLCEYLNDKNHTVHIWTDFMAKDIVKDLQHITKIFIGNDVPKLHYDVVNAHNHPAEIKSFAIDSKRIWYCNEPPEHILQGFPATDKELQIISKLDAIIVADAMNSNRFNKVYGIERYIVPYGIDNHWYQKLSNTKKKLGLQDNFVVLGPCWFNPYKNQLKSVQIIQSLIKDIPNIKIVFTGYDKGDYKQKVERYVIDNNLSKYVLFANYPIDMALKEYYSASDVMLCPFGPQGGFISVFEGIAYKIPIVISTTMGVSDLVKINKLGIVTENYKDAILDIYNNKYPINVEQSSKWVEEHITWDNYSKEILKIYERFI